MIEPKLLPIHTIAEAGEQAIKVMSDRQSGTDLPLKTKYPKLNNLLSGGISFDTNICFAGLSGSGKSALINEIQKEMCELNPKQEFDILFYSFEMNSYQHIIRNLSHDLKYEYSALISAQEKLNSTVLAMAKEYAKLYEKYPIYYCQTSGDVEQIYRTTLAFQDSQREKYNQPNRGLVYIVDHTTLVANQGGESEFNMLTRLSNMAIAIKLLNRRICGIFLSQLNSNIESDDRITKENLHEPRRSDLFNAKAIYNMADVVLVAHRPENLGIEFYTPNHYPTKGKMFICAIKNRLNTSNVTITYDIDFRYNIITEEESKSFEGKFKFD